MASGDGVELWVEGGRWADRLVPGIKQESIRPDAAFTCIQETNIFTWEKKHTVQREY